MENTGTWSLLLKGFLLLLCHISLVSSQCPCTDRSNLDISCLFSQKTESSIMDSCSESLKQWADEHLFAPFNASVGYVFIDGTIPFLDENAAKLQQLGRISQCVVRYGKGRFTELGMLELAEKFEDSLMTAAINPTDKSFELRGLQSHTGYILFANCRFDLINARINFTISSPVQYYRVSEWPQAPQQVKAYVSNRVYGKAIDDRHITLEWTPISTWDSVPTLYHAACVALQSHCNSCPYDFLSCQICARADGNVWSGEKGVEWYKTHAIIDINNLEATKFTSVICAVRAVGGGGANGQWSRPVTIDVDDVHPPPRLALAVVAQQQAHILLLDTSPTRGESTTPLRAIQNRKHSWPAVIDYECCANNDADSALPKIYPLDKDDAIVSSSPSGTFARTKVDPLVRDYCQNWIALTHYEIHQCVGNTERWCVSEIDDWTHNNVTIYEAEIGTVLHHIVCNPFSDYIAWTESNGNENTYRLMISQPIGAAARTFSSFCPDSCSATEQMVSPAIALDWARNGDILYIGSNEDTWTAGAGSICGCKTHSHLPASVETIPFISDIAIDWSNIYWVIKDVNGTDRLQFSPRADLGINNQQNNSVVFQPHSAYISNIDNGDEDGLQQWLMRPNSRAFTEIPLNYITDMEATAPEMRMHLTKEQYFPQISGVNVVMIDQSTAQATIRIAWPNPKSLRPPVLYRIRYAPTTTGTFTEDCKNNCPTRTSGGDVRSDVYTLSLENLEKDKNYIAQVTVLLAPRFDEAITTEVQFTASTGEPAPSSTSSTPEIETTTTTESVTTTTVTESPSSDTPAHQPPSESTSTESISTESVSTESISTEPVPADTTTTESPPTETVTTEPTPTEPVVTEPSPTEPIVTEPPSTEPPPTEPPPTEPPPTEPPPTEPPPTEPPPTEPPPTEPPPTEPVVTEPSPTEPIVTEPPPTEPIVTEPSPTEPAVTESPPTEAVTTESPPTEPAVVTEPPPTEPAVVTEPPTPPSTEAATNEPSPTEAVTTESIPPEPSSPTDPMRTEFAPTEPIIDDSVPTNSATAIKSTDRAQTDPSPSVPTVCTPTDCSHCLCGIPEWLKALIRFISSTS